MRPFFSYMESELEQEEWEAFEPGIASEQRAELQGEFLLHTFVHVFGGGVAILLVEVLLFAIGGSLAKTLLTIHWAPYLIACLLSSWALARGVVSVRDLAVQYTCLLGYGILAAFLLFPPLWELGSHLPSFAKCLAILLTFAFIFLMVIVIVLRNAFTRSSALILWGGALLPLGMVFLVYGFQAGPVLAFALTAYAGLTILLSIEAVLDQFTTDAYAGAALDLLSSPILFLTFTRD